MHCIEKKDAVDGPANLLIAEWRQAGKTGLGGCKTQLNKREQKPANVGTNLSNISIFCIRYE